MDWLRPTLSIHNTKVESPRDEHCYNCHINEKVDCIMGADHVPTSGSLVLGFCNPFGHKTEERMEEGESNHTLDMVVKVTAITDHYKKTKTGVTTSGLQGLVSYMTCSAATTGPMEKVSIYAYRRHLEAALRRPSPSLQQLTECAVPLKQQ